MQAIDAKTHSTYQLYDARGRMVKLTDRLGGITEFTFDAAGHQLSMEDAEGQTTSYTYSDRGEKLTEQYPDHVANTSPGDQHYGIVAYTYDPAGRLLRKTAQTGETITSLLDLAGRLTTREYRTLANGPSGTIADQDEFAYDANGRMLSAEKGRYSNTVARTYDGAGRPASESLTIGGQTYTVAAAYGTTAPTITLTYPDSSVVVKTLNSRGLLASVDRNSGDVVDRTYTDAGRLATQTFANSVVETWTWRNDGLVNSIDNPAGLFSYSYDANKNRTAETITGPLAAASWTTGATGFDNDDRLTYRNQGTGNLAESWDLSLVGDWDEYTENSTAVARTHGPTHEILTVGAASLTRDSKGNLTTDEKGQLLAWDFDNQLVSVDTDADTNLDVQYQYDALARRVGRTEWDYTPMTPTSTTEVYAHWQDDIAADYTAGAAASAPLRDYIHGLRIDELLAMIDRTDAGATSAGTDEPFYYHTDCVTSVRALSDANGDAVEYYLYNTYGAPTATDGALETVPVSSVNNRYLFTAREWDYLASHAHYRTRYLSPSLGRFESVDTIGYIDGPHLYLAYYVPHGTDPFGTSLIHKCRCTSSQSTEAGQSVPSVWNEYTTGDCYKACCDSRASNECCDGKIVYDPRIPELNTFCANNSCPACPESQCQELLSEVPGGMDYADNNTSTLRGSTINGWLGGESYCHTWKLNFKKSCPLDSPAAAKCVSRILKTIQFSGTSPRYGGWDDHGFNIVQSKCTSKCLLVDNGPFGGLIDPCKIPKTTLDPSADLTAKGQKTWNEILSSCKCK